MPEHQDSPSKPSTDKSETASPAAEQTAPASPTEDAGIHPAAGKHARPSGGQRPEQMPRSSDSETSTTTWLLRGVGFGIPALMFFAKIGTGGIWDPYELNVADLARRIAIHVWGAKSLILEDGENAMPTLGDLGRGELPFTSIGAGFASFGLHEWAGRLPLALWAMAGIGAVYWMFKRLSDERAAVFAAVVLATMPLYFVQARVMLGDIVTMAALAIAVAGGAVALFDRQSSVRGRMAAVSISAIGVGAGFLSRGLLVGVAVPLLTIGTAWVVSTVSRPEPVRDAVAQKIGAIALAAGVGCAIVGARAAFSLPQGQYSNLVGASIQPPSPMPTFDYVILFLGHGLFPWSAFIPFAIGRMFRAPNTGEASSDERELGLRTTLIIGASLSFGVLAMLAPKTGHIPFIGAACLAGIAAVAIRDLERGAPASRAMAIGVAVFVALFYRDFSMWPEKGFSPFGVPVTTFPESFTAGATRLILISGGIFAVMAFASWLEQDDPNKRPFSLQEYGQLPKVIRSAFDGNLSFFIVVVEAALAGFAVLFFVGMRFGWKQIVATGRNVRVAALNGWWAVPLVIVVGILAAFLFRDTCRYLFRTLKIPRAMSTLLGGGLAGAILGFSYYPALAAQLSPKEVFDSYAKLRNDGDKLGMLGINSRTASYASGGSIKTFNDADSAFHWLDDDTERRWLVFRNDDLGRLNSMYRGKGHAGTNLPILDARSSQILLASNKLLPTEVNQNPLNTIILAQKPEPRHPLDVELQGQLVTLGWDLLEGGNHKPATFVVAGKKYRLRLYYQVTGKISGDWESFIHIDGYQRRFNGDHKPMNGKYPMSHWQVGDYIVDDYDFALEPNFTPGGYTLYYGFFMGDTRMKVTRGNHHENRIDAGILQVQ